MAKRILAVLGGVSTANQSLSQLAKRADRIIAADSGQDVCKAAGFLPHLVVGDFDSLSEKLPAIEYREDLDQDRSDCDKLLDALMTEGEADVIIGGLEGDRLDHMLSSLTSIAKSSLSPRILLMGGVGHVLRAGNWKFAEFQPGTTFSLLPLAPSVVTVKGVEWELENATLEFGKFLSLSNIIRDNFELIIQSGVVLAVFNGELARWQPD
ncbi:MAG: thiamine diphosphokinase [Fimbriimonadaceae bacterium]|nr:MAG: thiamine diphosphokinase [Fimbriimonadaceae bacterium]